MSDVKAPATTAQTDGVAIGLLLGFNDGAPLVVYPSNPQDTALRGRSLVALSSDDIGSEVALLFEDGDRMRPLVIGRIIEHARTDPPPVVVRDGEPVQIHANHRLELICGKAKIVLEEDGRITIRGSTLVSHASAANRIRGGSIDLN
jgi:hypothetical protein